VQNVVDAIRLSQTVERAVFASSQLVCELGYVPAHETDYRPNTLYGQSKALGERIVRSADDIGASWTIVRPTSLWGPWFGAPYKDFFQAIAKGIYVHPSGASALKQWGFVGNAVFQVLKLLQAPANDIHGRTFYLADYEPLELKVFANQAQTALQSRPIRTVPRAMLKIAARAGDVAQGMGWKSVPLTSFRLRNVTTSEVQDLEPLASIVGPLPFTTEDGITMTVNWLRGQENTRSQPAPAADLAAPAGAKARIETGHR
jgi:GlcNAc-P-P-Und epimerase